MTWSKVSEGTFTVAASTGTETKTLPGSPLDGDLIIVASASDNTAGAPLVGGQGYTNIATNTAFNVGVHVDGKIRSGDTSVEINQSTNRLGAIAIQIWRGADSDFVDAAAQTATGTTGNPNPPSLTTVNANSLRMIVGGLDDDDQAATAGAPTGYTNLLAADTGQASASVGATVFIASKEQVSPGAEDPGAFTSSGSDAWFACHFSLKIDQGGIVPVVSNTYRQMRCS